jgi:RNA 3'-terminal phosphate cyclase (ATP)
LSREAGLLCVDLSNDTTALQPGAALAVVATDRGVARPGVDAAGARTRSAESQAKRVVSERCEDIASGATGDRHLVDQLVIYASPAPRVTDHVETNTWWTGSSGLGSRCPSVA